MGDWLGNQTTPPPRDYGKETMDTLQAQVAMAPDIYKAQAEYGPKYAQLGLQTAQQVTPGLLSLYEQQIAPSLTRTAAADQTARAGTEMGLVGQYAPEMSRILRESSGNANLLRLLTQEAESGLQAGAGMDPSLRDEVSQGVRAAQAARGFGFGAPDAVTEAFARGRQGEALRQARFQRAAQTAGINAATGGDPFMALLGRPSQTLGMMPGLANQASGYNPGMLFNPESGYAQDVFNTNYNADAAARIAEANAASALFGSMMESGGKLGGAAMMAF